MVGSKLTSYDQGSIPVTGKMFCLCHNVQTGCKVHSASYLTGTEGSLHSKSIQNMRLTKHVHVKNKGSFTSVLPMQHNSMAIWNRGNLTLTFTEVTIIHIALMNSKHNNNILKNFITKVLKQWEFYDWKL